MNDLGRGTQEKSYIQNIKGLGLLVADKKIFEVLPIEVQEKYLTFP